MDEQVDTLWSCLVMDKDTCDYALNWLYSQIKAKGCHSLTMHTYKYIYINKVSQTASCSSVLVRGAGISDELSVDDQTIYTTYWNSFVREFVCKCSQAQEIRSQQFQWSYHIMIIVHVVMDVCKMFSV